MVYTRESLEQIRHQEAERQRRLADADAKKLRASVPKTRIVIPTNDMNYAKGLVRLAILDPKSSMDLIQTLREKLAIGRFQSLMAMAKAFAVFQNEFEIAVKFRDLSQ